MTAPALSAGCAVVVKSAREALVTDPRVNKIAFTSSTAAGRHIGSILGERLAHMTLELGGKSAAVILDDYDLDSAAKELAPRLLHAGTVGHNAYRGDFRMSFGG
jgi:aldehyde dehydrogenase (NAD+)